MIDKVPVSSYFKTFYEGVKNKGISLVQGGIYIPSKEFDNILGIIVISNNCDLSQDKSALKYISYLPILDGETYVNSSKRDNIKRWIRIIQERHQIYFYLPPYEELINGIGGIVNFQNVRSTKIEKFLNRYNKPSLVLKSPFRERLNMCVNKLFNRVPINHPNSDEINNWLESNYYRD